MPVTVAELDAYQVRVPLRKPVRHASHTRRESDNVVVRCRLSDGSVGWGEGVPRDYVTGETIDSALALLKQTTWRRRRGAASFARGGGTLAETLRAARRCRGTTAGALSNAARCAVELALLDAYGRSLRRAADGRDAARLPRNCTSRAGVVRYDGVVLSAKGWKARVTTLAPAALRPEAT